MTSDTPQLKPNAIPADPASDPARGPGPRDSILVAEDDAELADALLAALRMAKFAAEWVADGREVAQAIEASAPALIVLDLMRSGRDSLTVCRELRCYSDTPVVMTSERSEESDRLLAFEMGTDDYVCKPCNPREVVARVKAVLRRTRCADAAAGTGLHVDPQKYEAVLDGQRLKLTPVELRLLAVLAKPPRGRVFSRAQLLDGAYADHRVVCDRAIDTHVKNLRRHLNAVRPGQELITSVYGVGYKLVLP